MALSDEEYKARRDAALFKFEDASRVMHRFTTFDETQDVPTASGPIPSLRKLIAQIRAEGSQAAIDPALLLLAQVVEESVDEESDFIPKPLP